MYYFLCEIPLRNIRRLKIEHMLWNGILKDKDIRYELRRTNYMYFTSLKMMSRSEMNAYIWKNDLK